MDRLTEEDINAMRPPSDYLWTLAQEKQNALCDLALQSLSQESVRSEALEEAAKFANDKWMHGRENVVAGIRALSPARVAEGGPSGESVMDQLVKALNAFDNDVDMGDLESISEWWAKSGSKALNAWRASPDPAPESPAQEQPGEQNADAQDAAAMIEKLGQGWIPKEDKRP